MAEQAKIVSPTRRVWLWLALGVLLVALALGYREFYLARPIGSGPAGPTVAREAFAEPWSRRKVVLVGFGDSVVAGYGASPGKSLFERLVRNPADEFDEMRGVCLSAVLPNLTTLNASVSGTTSLEHLSLLKNKIPLADRDTFGIVVLTTGGNDVIHNYGRTPGREGAMYGASFAEAQPWIANFESRLNEILAELEAKFPGGCRIFLADIYDPTDGVGDIESAGLPAWPAGLQVLAAYNEVIERVAKQRPAVVLVNMRSLFLGHGIHCRQRWRPDYDAHDPTYWYYANLEDPNDRGYDALRREFLVEMSRVLPTALNMPGPVDKEVPMP